MSYPIPKGHSATDLDLADFIRMPGVFTFATLPKPALINNANVGGLLGYTSDQGMCYWNPATGAWVALAGGGGGTVGPTNTPGFGASVLTPTQLITSQNDYSPTSWAITVSKLRLNAASGGSTVTGIAALTFADGASIQVFNISTTDTITFPNASASSLAANRFLCANAASVVLPPNAGTFMSRDGGIWRLS